MTFTVRGPFVPPEIGLFGVSGFLWSAPHILTIYTSEPAKVSAELTLVTDLCWAALERLNPSPVHGLERPHKVDVVVYARAP